MQRRVDKLKQEGSITGYQVRFEELRSLMFNFHPTLNKSYFVSNFIRGLKDELRFTVKMMSTAMVKQVTEKARLQELALEAICRKHGLQPRSSSISSQQIESTSMAANQVMQESEEKSEVDQSVVTHDSNEEERLDKEICEDYILYLQEADEAA